jgi:hypothetical protein
MLAGLILLGRALGLAEQLGHHQQIKQLPASSIDLARRYATDCHQRRHPARARVPAQPRRLGGHPVAREVNEPPLRQTASRSRVPGSIVPIAPTTYLAYYNTDRVHHGRLTQGRIAADIVYGARKMEAR